VISHDRTFLEEFAPTHVLTVRDGTARLEERELQESDWKDDLNSRDSAAKFASAASEVQSTSSTKSSNKNSDSVGNKKGKKAAKDKVGSIDFSTTTVASAGKKDLSQDEKARRIFKIESSIAKNDKELFRLEDEMMSNGNNRDKLMELQKRVDEMRVKNEKLYNEYEVLIA
jgi:hypothetical protein